MHEWKQFACNVKSFFGVKKKKKKKNFNISSAEHFTQMVRVKDCILTVNVHYQ